MSFGVHSLNYGGIACTQLPSAYEDVQHCKCRVDAAESCTRDCDYDAAVVLIDDSAVLQLQELILR